MDKVVINNREHRIETERLSIRPYLLEDLHDVYEQFSNTVVTKYIGGIKTYEEVKQYLADKIAFLKQNFPLGRRAIVLKKSNMVIGYCGLEPILIEDEYIVELSYGLNYECWGKGYALEAAKAMLDYGFVTIGLSEIYSVINPTNSGSMNIAKKLGLQYQKDVDWPNQGKVNLFMIESDRNTKIRFKKFTHHDIPLFYHWAEKPHVKNTWFQEGYEPKEKILEKIEGNGYDYPFIILIDDSPVGYIQYEDLVAYYKVNPDSKNKYYANEPAGTYCIDLFIAEEDFLNKGYGTKIIRKFSNCLLTKPEVKKLVIDPSVSNKKAIRCYEKAGFKYVRTAKDEIDEYYIMEKTTT